MQVSELIVIPVVVSMVIPAMVCWNWCCSPYSPDTSFAVYIAVGDALV